MGLLNYFSMSKPSANVLSEEEGMRKLSKLRWQVFLAATIGYGMFYVCRLSLNVMKKPIVDAGIMSEGELGIIGSGLFITYAIGKFVNGFLADRSNVRRFMAFGLLVSALINLALGFTISFFIFMVLWALNGWVQSMGAAPCVVALSRWYDDKHRGTMYGFWSSSHNIGEAITFVLTAFVVALAGWQWGFRVAGLLGVLGVVLIALVLPDTPQSYGLRLNVSNESDSQDTSKIAECQRRVLLNPAVWMLALGSAFMYVSRYAVSSWGIFYLEAGKGFTTLEAGTIISISSVCGILGTVSAGWLSDKLFGGRRNAPALILGLMNAVGLALFLFSPARSFYFAATGMIIFGLAIGGLVCFLGGLMAVDICSKRASGAALGVVGIASYIGAALQDVVSGFMIQSSVKPLQGEASYDFSMVVWFWLGSALLSVLCVLSVWKAGKSR